MIVLDVIAGALMMMVIFVGVPMLALANGHRRFIRGTLIVACLMFGGWLNYIGFRVEELRPVLYIAIGVTLLWMLRVPPLHK